MKKYNLFSILIGFFVIIQSIFFCKTIAVSIALFLLGILNLFLGFNGLEWYMKKVSEKRKNKNPF